MVGVPVTTIFFAFGNLFTTSSNPTNTTSTFLDNIFTAIPGKALLSCNAVGIFFDFAASITGIQIYPPVPITTSGLNSSIIFFASPIDLNVLYVLFILSNEIFLSKPYASIVFSSYPALGTKSFSKPLLVVLSLFY